MQISSLYEFIDRAVRNRNYASNTASGLKAALKRFEAEANEEERASVEKFKSHIEQIYREVVTKNKDFSAESLAVYKSRVLKIINDYEKYGADPTKMANWSTKAVTRTKRHKEESISKNTGSEAVDELVKAPAGMQRLEFPLRAGIKVVMILPEDLTTSDVKKIKSLLDLVEVKE